MSIMSDARRVLGLLKPERKSYTLGLGALSAVNFSDAAAPIFMAVAIDLTEAAITQSVPSTPPLLTKLGISAGSFSIMGAIGCYLLLMLVGNVARYPMMMHTAVPSHRIGQTLRRELATHLLRLSQPFYDRAKSGDLMSLATADINAVRMMLGPGVLVGMDTTLLASMVLLVMFAMSWQLALIAIIPLPLIAIVTNVLAHAEYDRFEAVQEDLGALTERVRESYAGIRIIQGYAREEHDEERFHDHSLGHYAKNMHLTRIRSVFDPTLDLFMGASNVLVFIFGGLMVLEGSITLGTFVAFIFLINYLSGPMIGFGWSVTLFQRGRASLRRLDEFWAQPIEIADHGAVVASHADASGHILIKDLSFTYAGPAPLDDEELLLARSQEEAEQQELRPALSHVSLEIPAGTTLGLIGAVGSGKSTLARMLVRLYEPPEGSILLDGKPLHDISLKSLREAIVMAPQNTFLFSDTVERNVMISAAQPDASPAVYTQLASLHEEIDALKKGYDTMLGERGVNLSGGQRQRLAIARAIAADPKVLILDDCLSAVDARTEEAILENLRRVFDGRTGIIISHRVRAVQRCDQIAVLEQGRVIERGTHKQLLAMEDGVYARIAREQVDEQEDDLDGAAE